MSELMSKPMPEPTVEQMLRTPIPYYASKSILPAPLPTVEDIEKARETGNLNPYGRRCGTYRVNNFFVVKFGCHPIIFQEGENMLFIQQNSNVRMPKVYAMFSHRGADPDGELSKIRRSWETQPTQDDLPTYNYLVTEYIEGGDLETRWSLLSEDDLSKVTSKIGEQLHLLHAIPPPSPAYYGRVYHQGWEPYFPLLYDFATLDRLRGPYNSYNDFLSAIQAYTQKAADRGKDYEKDYLARRLPDMFTSARGATSTFTHWDIAPRNVIATRVHGTDGADDFVITLVDWAHAGWLPEWFEWAMILRRMPGDDPAGGKWLLGLEKALNPQYVAEAELFRTYAQTFYAIGL